MLPSRVVLRKLPLRNTVRVSDSLEALFFLLAGYLIPGSGNISFSVISSALCW